MVTFRFQTPPQLFLADFNSYVLSALEVGRDPIEGIIDEWDTALGRVSGPYDVRIYMQNRSETSATLTGSDLILDDGTILLTLRDINLRFTDSEVPFEFTLNQFSVFGTESDDRFENDAPSGFNLEESSPFFIGGTLTNVFFEPAGGFQGLIDGLGGVDIIDYRNTENSTLQALSQQIDLTVDGDAVRYSARENQSSVVVRNIETFVFDDRSLSIEQFRQWIMTKDEFGLDYVNAFDTMFYNSNNSDLYESGIEPVFHYSTSGWMEGRDPSPTFDTDAYLAANPDVAASGMNPFAHYVHFGMAEGRDGAPGDGGGGVAQPDSVAEAFDAPYYTSTYADIASAGIDPYEHYLRYGWLEGRDPSPTFDTDAYLAANPDVAASGMNPFAHYTLFGMAEGRDGTPDLIIG